MPRQLILLLIFNVVYLNANYVNQLKGCLYKDICDDEEYCYNDNLFGICLTVNEQVPGMVYNMTKTESKIIYEILSELKSGNYYWTDAYTQCLLGVTIQSFRDKSIPDLSICKNINRINDQKLFNYNLPLISINPKESMINDVEIEMEVPPNKRNRVDDESNENYYNVVPTILDGSNDNYDYSDVNTKSYQPIDDYIIDVDNTRPSKHSDNIDYYSEEPIAALGNRERVQDEIFDNNNNNNNELNILAKRSSISSDVEKRIIEKLMRHKYERAKRLLELDEDKWRQMISQPSTNSDDDSIDSDFINHGIYNIIGKNEMGRGNKKFLQNIQDLLKQDQYHSYFNSYNINDDIDGDSNNKNNNDDKYIEIENILPPVLISNENNRRINNENLLPEREATSPFLKGFDYEDFNNDDGFKSEKLNMPLADDRQTKEDESNAEFEMSPSELTKFKELVMKDLENKGFDDMGRTGADENGYPLTQPEANIDESIYYNYKPNVAEEKWSRSMFKPKQLDIPKKLLNDRIEKLVDKKRKLVSSKVHMKRPKLFEKELMGLAKNEQKRSYILQVPTSMVFYITFDKAVNEDDLSYLKVYFKRVFNVKSESISLLDKTKVEIMIKSVPQFTGRILRQLAMGKNTVLPGHSITNLAIKYDKRDFATAVKQNKYSQAIGITVITCSLVLFIVMMYALYKFLTLKLNVDMTNGKKAAYSKHQSFFNSIFKSCSKSTNDDSTLKKGGEQVVPIIVTKSTAKEEIHREHVQQTKQHNSSTISRQTTGSATNKNDNNVDAWVDDTSKSNMDISTGHAILNCMEGYLKAKDKLDAEWETLSVYEPDNVDFHSANLPENRPKNRYIDSLPYEHSRVHLSDDSGSDYINANYIIEHDPKAPEYIVTQGALSNTVNEFWSMVWEQGSTVIVNLSCLIEAGVPMCHKYWPEEGSQFYGGFEIHLVSEHVWCEEYVVRSFYLKNVGTNETRTVTQFHYIAWPDMDIPPNSQSLLEFRRKVNKSFRNKRSPMIVHCSDGCGRTGTYILLDMIMNRLHKGVKEVDVAAALEHIRDQRSGMVKTKEQFEFVLTCIAEEVMKIMSDLSH